MIFKIKRIKKKKSKGYYYIIFGKDQISTSILGRAENFTIAKFKAQKLVDKYGGIISAR